jgi:DUF1680 family protein
MDGRRVPNTIDIAFQIRPGSPELNCCSVNAARGFGMISDWALMADKDGLVLNWYGPSEMTAAVKGASVSLKQRTGYPADGRIDLSVDPAVPVEFTLKLRIPHWSKSASVKVNGEAMPAKAGSYLAITRKWRSGDAVQLDLDMSFRFWAGEQQCTGKASIYRGPLLLAYEEANSSSLKSSDQGNLPQLAARMLNAKTITQNEKEAFLLVDVKDLSGKAVRLRDFGSAGQNGVLYWSWLPVEGVAPVEFSKSNPSRTAAVAD